MSTQFTDGQKVIHNGEVRTIYSVYDNENVSLCLIDEEGYEYTDIEEDYLTPMNEIKVKEQK